MSPSPGVATTPVGEAGSVVTWYPAPGGDCPAGFIVATEKAVVDPAALDVSVILVADVVSSTDPPAKTAYPEAPRTRFHASVAPDAVTRVAVSPVGAVSTQCRLAVWGCPVQYVDQKAAVRGVAEPLEAKLAATTKATRAPART